MRLLAAFYPLHDLIAASVPQLPPGQLRQLTLWVAGTLSAGSGCEAAVVLARSEAAAAAGACLDENSIREDLPDLLRDAGEKRTPVGRELDVGSCFAPVLAGVLARWQGQQLALAIDATH